MKPLAPIALGVLAAAAQAAPQTPRPQAQASATGAAPRKFAGVSDAGNALLAAALAAPDPQYSTLVHQQRAAHEKLVGASMAATIDLDAVAALLKQEDAARAQARARYDDRLIAAMRQLTPEDRGPFLRALIPPATGAPR